MQPRDFLRSATHGVPPFGLRILFGLGAGAFAGLLVLGPGLRLAMRVVALQDTFRTPEFTFGGTFFIVIFLGLIVGVPLGLAGAMVDRFLPRMAAIMIMSAAGMGFLIADSEIMREFFDLGAGAWINIPMFSSVFVGYSASVLGLVHRLSRAAGPDSEGSRGEDVMHEPVGGAL